VDSNRGEIMEFKKLDKLPKLGWYWWSEGENPEIYHEIIFVGSFGFLRAGVRELIKTPIGIFSDKIEEPGK
jgi:hypothetical protein